MKFRYKYKTSDGAQHEGIYSAPSKTAVYEELKKNGVKPFGVEPVPGFFNWLSGALSRFWLAIVTPIVAVLVFNFLMPEEPSIGIVKVRDGNQDLTMDTFLTDTTRRQLIGDSSIIEASILNGWDNVFPEEGERFLASFAIPGYPAGVRATNVAQLEAALSRKVLPVAGDSIEAVQIKSMVEGMKEELREYVADGGTIEQYGERLVERQEREIAYYQRLKTELESSSLPQDELYQLWQSSNDDLRNKGIRSIPLPE